MEFCGKIGQKRKAGIENTGIIWSRETIVQKHEKQKSE